MPNSKRWIIHPHLSPEADANLAKFPPVLRQLLYNRGYGTEVEADAFLKAETTFEPDPFQLTGMGPATDRLCSALDDGEPIAIYGDYDVDGVTATALLVQTLRAFGGNADGYIPNRFDEGYGLNNDALDSLKAKGVKLVITVDCGIRSPHEAEHARDIGLDLIISDHHHPAIGELPPALAVINPKQPGDAYRDKNLAGVGIAYKMAQALFQCRAPLKNLQLADLLDLVALGTVADLAPLTGENRMLVRKGLEQIHETKRQGLYSLANVAEMVLGKTNATQIGFVLGPRLNAAGRLESALAAFELLTTTDFMVAGQLAQQLDVQNRKRQELTRLIQEKAEMLATADEKEPLLLMAVDREFNSGVVGLAASRLTEKYYRPAIVAAQGETETRGSCRSIPEFHITDALDKCADLLVRHGGHAAAAGFTVRNDHLPELILRLKDIAQRELGHLDLRKSLTADIELPLAQLGYDLLRHLAGFEPTGYGNTEALFVSRNVKVRSSRTVGAEGKHLKLALENERGAIVDAIGFRMGDKQPTLPARVDVLYSFEPNEYNGRSSLQLNLKDLRPAGIAD
jgi:single-stranded-DNA-specific exonuclease